MKVEFIPSSIIVSDLLEAPNPAKEEIPQWYKNIPSFYKDVNKEFSSQGQLLNTNVKMCMPFFDALTGGFIQKTWCDIYIKKTENSVNYYWPTEPQILGHRDKTHMPINDKFYNLEFYWRMPWIPKLPTGYSVLLTHPHNRLDLPFVTASGIIDSDDFYHVEFGQYPFYINKDFEGLIPKGTPMYQMMPFKRESWSSSRLQYHKKTQKKRSFEVLKNYWGVYKNKFWKKKIYE